MKRVIWVAVFTVQMVLIAHIASTQELWVGKDGNIRNTDVRAISSSGEHMYLATKNEVYRLNGTKRWESIFSIPSTDNEVNCILGYGSKLFIGTRRGLLRSDDLGQTWKKSFKGVSPGKNDIRWIEPTGSSGDKILIATGMGVFESSDNGIRWNDISGILNNGHVGCIACKDDMIFASADEGIFARMSQEDGWRRINSGRPLTDRDDEADHNDAEYEDDTRYWPDSVIGLSDNRLYVANGDRIQFSDDLGATWSDMTNEGIVGTITSILPSPGSERIFSSTTMGVFEYLAKEGRWVELYKGFGKTVNVRRIIFDVDSNDVLWAIADSGVYRYELGVIEENRYINMESNVPDIRIIYNREPPFKDLQEAAMRFAEVSPDKIKNWRMQARLRALVPKVSFDIDNNVSNTYEIYTSSTKNYAVLGPDDQTKGFDISISWELGDLVWSTDQTSIDVRSRLTTQLRNDVLDDLRRAYYERKRLQFELMADPPDDIKKNFAKELRIRELTQTIDDLTGNYFSEYMDNHKKAHKDNG